MTLLVTPNDYQLMTAKPLMRERNFRVHLRCPHCETTGSVDVPMFGEMRGRGCTEHFVEVGGMALIENTCGHCGEEGIIVRYVQYVPAPDEPPPAAMQDD